MPGEEPALRSSYGIIEEVLSIPVAFIPAPLFLKIKWYKQSIAAEDAHIRNVPLVKCSGTSSGFEPRDVDVSKETVLMRANKIDQQACFVDCPGWSTRFANLPWRWVCREVTSKRRNSIRLPSERALVSLIFAFQVSKCPFYTNSASKTEAGACLVCCIAR